MEKRSIMNRKIKTAIIGPGNIGLDLLFKMADNKILEPILMIGIYESSEGLAIAKSRGLQITTKGVGALTKDDGVEIVFDATSAAAHLENAKILQELGKYAIDLTPAAVGPYCVPAISNDYIDTEHMNYNMVTCGGQATIPIIHAISSVCPVAYGEIVSTIASKSAGPGTRANIDEFTITTAKGIVQMGGAKKGKAIIILNPAEPPLYMRNTVRAKVENMNQPGIENSIYTMVSKLQKYVPGYRLLIPPMFDSGNVTVMIEVEGAGHYLPKYAGNLDIMTSAAIQVGEILGSKLQGGRVEDETYSYH